MNQGLSFFLLAGVEEVDLLPAFRDKNFSKLAVVVPFHLTAFLFFLHSFSQPLSVEFLLKSALFAYEIQSMEYAMLYSSTGSFRSFSQAATCPTCQPHPVEALHSPVLLLKVKQKSCEHQFL